MKKRTCMLVLAILLATILPLSLLFKRPGVGRRGFEQIQAGMLRWQVESILGEPTTLASKVGTPQFNVLEDGTITLDDLIMDGLGGAHLRVVAPVPSGMDTNRLRFGVWQSDLATILLFFDEDGCVIGSKFIDHIPPPSLVERVRELLGW